MGQEDKQISFEKTGGNGAMNGRFNWLKMWMSLSILLLLFSQAAGLSQIGDIPVIPNDGIITVKAFHLLSLICFLAKSNTKTQKYQNIRG